MNNKLVFRNIGRWFLLVLLQVLVFNNINLGGYINPFLYVLFIAMLPTNTSAIAMLVIAFFTGLSVDVCTNMLGFHAAACTMAAFLRVVWLDKILLRDSDDTIDTPSLYSPSYQQFMIYLFLILLGFSLTYYVLVVFSIRDIFSILLSTLLSTIVSWLLAILYQTLFFRKQRLNDNVR